VRHRLKREDLRGVRVAIQGLGHVGYNLARLLRQDGAELIVADLDPMRAERAALEFGARAVAPEAILGVEAEVLAPCALGGVINDLTLPKLACAIVAGAANNQLLEARHGAALSARGAGVRACRRSPAPPGRPARLAPHRRGQARCGRAGRRWPKPAAARRLATLESDRRTAGEGS
jgi:hypothetical protein